MFRLRRQKHEPSKMHKTGLFCNGLADNSGLVIVGCMYVLVNGQIPKGKFIYLATYDFLVLFPSPITYSMSSEKMSPERKWVMLSNLSALGVVMMVCIRNPFFLGQGPHTGNMLSSVLVRLDRRHNQCCVGQNESIRMTSDLSYLICKLWRIRG